MTPADWYLAAALISVFLGAGAFRFPRGGVREDRLLTVCLPPLVFLAASTCVIWAASSGVQQATWHNARLLPSLAILKGLNPYSSLKHGSVQTSVYPPVWVLAFLPVGTAKSPGRVIFLGYIVAQCYAMLPALAFFWRSSRNIKITVICFTWFVYALNFTGPLNAGFVPHADAPALGFALAAILLLQAALRSGGGRRESWLHFLSTVAGWCAVGSKQVVAPIFVVMTLVILRAGGWRAVVRFCGWAAASGLLVALVCFSIFPIGDVYFNTIQLMARCPWNGTLPWNLVTVFFELFDASLPVLLFLAAGYGTWYALRGEASAQPHARYAEDWQVAGLAALLFLPTSVLGRVKVGGSPNTLSPTIYFLLAAACLLVPAILARLDSSAAQRQSMKAFKLVLVLVSLTLSMQWFWWGFDYVRTRKLSTRNNAAHIAYNYLKNNGPGAYFTGLPLSHLMAEGKLYNFGSAVYDREVLARFPLSEEQKTRYFPANPTMVCGNVPMWGAEYVESKYFPKYTKKIDVPELPGFRCMTKPSSPPPD